MLCKVTWLEWGVSAGHTLPNQTLGVENWGSKAEQVTQHSMMTTGCQQIFGSFETLIELKIAKTKC